MKAVNEKMILACCFLLATSACAPEDDSISYESKASLVQNIDVGKEKAVTFVFSCSAFSVNRLANIRAINLEISGAYSIDGYHGTAEDAGARPIEPAAFEFRVSREGNTLIVDSPEWTLIHHALYVENLRVTVPSEMTVKVECLTYEQMEKRGRSR